MIGQFKNVKELVLATYPKLPVLLPVLWKFSRALLLLKILYNPNERFSDFKKFQKSDTSGSLIFELKKNKTQEPKVLNKIKEPPNIGIYRQRAESLQSGLISCLFLKQIFMVCFVCGWWGALAWQQQCRSCGVFHNLKLFHMMEYQIWKEGTKPACTAIAMQGQIHNRLSSYEKWQTIVWTLGQFTTCSSFIILAIYYEGTSQWSKLF